MSLLSNIKKGIACDSVGKPESAIGRAICLSVHPGKMLLFPFLHWFKYHYEGRYKFARLMFAFDLFLIGVALTLGVIALSATVFRQKAFEDLIHFEATVAPREVITGAPATIAIRYTNSTDEELKDANLSIIFPRYFVLQEGEEFQHLGTIPAGESGNIHLKGIMYGNVGAEQAFQTKLTFVHGLEKNIPGEKIDSYVFAVSRSAVALSLELPDRLIAFQPMEGVVRYHNQTNAEFPTISILPEWPKAFVFTKSEATFRNGQFELPPVSAGETGEFRFTGLLKEALENVTFVFEPSFTFDDVRFKQEILRHTAPVVPLPIQLHHQIAEKAVAPGSELTVQVEYTNTADVPVTDVSFGMESDNPFFIEPEPMIKESIAPGEQGTIDLVIKLRSSILPTQTDAYEHLLFVTRAVAKFSLDNQNGQRVIAKGRALELRMTTPVRLDAFARYFAPSGDQIGRGPLPPEIGQETTYWIFWHIAGTTNELKSARIEATLPEGVRFTGRQTVSQNGSITYDPKTRVVTWSSNEVAPTFAPSSKIVGVAFEVGITPEANLKSAPVLVQDTHLTATDGFTGAFISAKAKNLAALLK